MRPSTKPSLQHHSNSLAGLNPLPTTQQVLAAVAIGRADPFAPLPSAAGGATQPGALPAGFRFNGVLRSGAQAQALVQLGSLSGSLSAGEVGGKTTVLLPPGWQVAAVDAQRGRLSLRQGTQLITLDL